MKNFISCSLYAWIVSVISNKLIAQLSHYKSLRYVPSYWNYIHMGEQSGIQMAASTAMPTVSRFGLSLPFYADIHDIIVKYSLYFFQKMKSKLECWS